MKSEKLVSLVKEMADYGGAVEKNSGGITYYKNRYGYVFGAQGETYTKELAQKWGDQKRSGKSATYFVTNCKKWYTPPRKVVDCSGMIVLAMRTEDSDYGDRTANTFKNQFTQSGRIGTLPDIPGVAVWKNGHIGIYIGNNLVVEARGYAYGVVVSKVSANSWTYWGKLKDVEYEGGASSGVPETPEATTPPTNWTVSRLLKKTSPLMSGEDVKNVQKALIAKGYSCGGSGADGKYGDDTVAAVKKFQKAKGLSVDGQAGKNTVTALGGKWQGSTTTQPTGDWTVSRLLKKTSPLMSGEDVKNVQKALIAKGYSCGGSGADGKYGDDTVAAVKKFQKAKGLSVDGQAGKNTVTALGGKWAGSSSATSWTVSRLLKKTSPLMSGEDVKNLQKALIAKGYSCGSSGTDGKYGDDTVAAVKKFQKAKGLSVDGQAGKNTVTALGGKWQGSTTTQPTGDWTVSRLLKKTSPLMSGEDVKNVQKALIAKGYSCGGSGADGKYGDDTVAAVKKFQKAKGLSVDGQAGKNTVTALGGKWNG